jgi:hypothetical protein
LESAAGNEVRLDPDLEFVARAFANGRLGQIGLDNGPATLERLTAIARTAGNVAVRARALLVAATIVQDSGLSDRCHELLTIGLALEAEPLQDHSQLELRLAIGMVHAHLGNHAESLHSLEVGRALIDDKHIQSSIADTVINALGAICCASGAYEIGLGHFSRAYQMRTRLGNDWTRAVTAANAALCCGRLGQYERQVEWSAISMKLLGPEFTGFRDIQAATYHAMGLAMTGKRDQALGSIDWLDQRIPESANAWLRQGWHLYKADLLLLLGRRSAAMSEAARGIGGEHEHLHAKAFAGPYARWLALTAKDSMLPEIHLKIGKLRSRLEALDAIDQVEVLGAALQLAKRQPRAMGPKAFGKDLRLMVAKAGALPSATRGVLVTLGLSDALASGPTSKGKLAAKQPASNGTETPPVQQPGLIPR